jgi:CBS domain-containing protein
MDDPARFLARCPPFDGLAADDLARIAAQADERHVPVGARVLVEDGPPGTALFVIRSGAMELHRGEQVVDVIGPGEVFGHPTLVTGRAPAFTVRCREEAVLYAIPREAALEVLESRRGLEFVAETLRERLTHTVQAICATPSTRAVHLASLIRRAPVFVDPETTVTETAKLMSEELVKAVLIVSPRGLGMVTEGDLRDRVLAAGISPETPVGRIMTTPLRTMREDRLAIEAAIEMMRLGINHMPVVDARGKVVGVISSGSLMRLDALSPFALAWSFSTAKSEDEVVRVAGHIPGLFLSLLDTHLEAGDICRVLTVQHDAATTRLLQLAFERHGPPPVSYSWLALGSVARWELTLTSDQDNALAYEGHDDPAVDGYFAAVAAEVTTGLEHCGYPADVSGVMANDSRWRKSAATWMAIFEDCLDKPDSSNLVRAAISFDLRAVAGDLDFVGPLAQLLRQAPEHPGFLVRLGRTVTAVPSPLGFRQRLVGPLDVKKSAALPVENLARFYALSNRVVVSSTLDRLAALEGMGAVTDSTVKSLREAYLIALKVRLRHHAEAVRAGRAPDNVVDSDTLAPLAKQDLQAALRAILAAQRQLANYVPLGM